MQSLPIIEKTPSLEVRKFRPARSRTLRVGFVQLNDAAPFVIAESRGIFEKYDLDVKLSRELGWATIRDKIIYGELEASQALAPMPFASTLGLQQPFARECVAAMILNVNGNALTLGNHLHDEGVYELKDLPAAVRRRPVDHKMTFGVVSTFSSHNILLHTCLKRLKLNPQRDVRIVVIPPAQMMRNLLSRHLDGYLVGDPWNSAAVNLEAGWIAATSETLSPGHPEKVLMMRHDFIHNASEECLRLIRALTEACEFCQDPSNRFELVKTLADKKYIHCPEVWLHYGFGLPLGKDAPTPELNLHTLSFFGSQVNAPSPTHARWIIQGMRDTGLLGNQPVDETKLSTSILASDFYQAALKMNFK